MHRKNKGKKIISWPPVSGLWKLGLAAALLLIVGAELCTFIPKINPAMDLLRRDPAKAYAQLKTNLLKKPLSDQHNGAHKFGEDLFATIGLSGIRVCDDAFSYGCYHGFFSKAVALNGLGIVDKLDEECGLWKLKGRCQHGIGHGILEFYGSNDRILDALRACDRLRRFSTYAGCSGGVFMEYNFRTGRDRGRSGPRPVTEKNVMTPCIDIPDRYAQTCYFYQPQWWDSLYNSDYKKIGDLCDSLSTIALRRTCYQGAGNIIAPRFEFDTQKSLAKCDEIEDAEGRVYCKIGLARIFLTGAQKDKESSQICSLLTPEQNALCKKERSL